MTAANGDLLDVLVVGAGPTGLTLADELVGRGNDAVWVRLHAGGRVVGIRLFGLGLDDRDLDQPAAAPAPHRGRPPGCCP